MLEASELLAAVFAPYTLTGDFHLNIQGRCNCVDFGKYVFLEMQFGILTITTKKNLH